MKQFDFSVKKIVAFVLAFIVLMVVAAADCLNTFQLIVGILGPILLWIFLDLNREFEGKDTIILVITPEDLESEDEGDQEDEGDPEDEPDPADPDSNEDTGGIETEA